MDTAEYVCGMGEVVKYALIGDLQLYEFIDSNFTDISSENIEINEKLVTISAQHKANIVAQDEKEMGIRAILNFGHTFGHALEKFYKYENLKHGQAVLLGMKCAIFASRKLNLTNESFANKTIEFINRFKVNLPQNLSHENISDMLKYMQHDKKVKNGKINFILLKNIGDVFKTAIADENIIREAFGVLK